MPINGVIGGKLTNMERVISNLRSLGPLDERRLEDWILCSAVERNLQVAVEIVIDICHRLNSLGGRTPATSAREAVEGCVTLGALSGVEPFSQMIGFRNLVVHQYEHVDPSVLVAIVNSHLDDFDRFRNEILSYVARQ